MKALKLTALCLVVSLMMAVPVAKGDAVWNRQTDWAADPAAESIGGPLNPSPDSAGNPAYKHVWATGTGLDDPTVVNRWYAQPGTPMVWDPSWAGGPRKLWAVANDVAANIRSDLMTQVTTGWTGTYAPMVRWENPTGARMGIKATGTLRLEWYGSYTSDPTVDVVIARVGSMPGDIQELKSWSVNYSQAEVIQGSTSGMFFNISDLDITPAYAIVKADDTIVWSLRSRQTAMDFSTSVRLVDTSLILTEVPESEVPEPLTVGLLLCGGVGMLFHRRRSRRSAE